MLFFRRNISSYSDSELVRLYKETGESDYFGELYNRYIPVSYTHLPEDKTEELVEFSKRAPRNEVARFILEDLDRAISLLKPGTAFNLSLIHIWLSTRR